MGGSGRVSRGLTAGWIPEALCGKQRIHTRPANANERLLLQVRAGQSQQQCLCFARYCDGGCPRSGIHDQNTVSSSRHSELWRRASSITSASKKATTTSSLLILLTSPHQTIIAPSSRRLPTPIALSPSSSITPNNAVPH